MGGSSGAVVVLCRYQWVPLLMPLYLCGVPGKVVGVDLMEEYRRATLYFESGDPAGAARLLEPIIEAEPRNLAVRQLLARAYFGSAQLSRAETHLKVLLEQDPSDHYAHHVLGRTLERQGRRPEALRHLRLAAAMNPENYDYQSAVIRVENQLSASG